MTSTPRRLRACANSHAIGPAPPIASEAGRSVRCSRSSLVRYVTALEAGDRGDPRTRAHGQHRGHASQHRLALVVADDQRAVAEAPVPVHAQDAVALQQLLVEPPPVVDHLVDTGHHGGAVDLDRRPHAELVAAACPVCDLGCPDQGLRRDAPDVDSGAAERLGLDHRDARAQAARAHRAGDAAHAATDHDELGRVRLELRQRRCQTSSGATRAIVSSTSSRRPCSASRRSTPSGSTRYCPTFMSGGE